MMPAGVTVNVETLEVRGHCEACGSRFAVAQPNVAGKAAAWGQAHYRPLVDEVVTNCGTWRRHA